MPIDFGSARLWAQEALCRAVPAGRRCVDATLGNGHDCVRLCELVGEEGVVYGFGIQPEAVERTRARLEQRGLLSRRGCFARGMKPWRASCPGRWTRSCSTWAGCPARRMDHDPRRHHARRRRPGRGTARPRWAAERVRLSRTRGGKARARGAVCLGRRRFRRVLTSFCAAISTAPTIRPNGWASAEDGAWPTPDRRSPLKAHPPPHPRRFFCLPCAL